MECCCHQWSAIAVSGTLLPSVECCCHQWNVVAVSGVLLLPVGCHCLVFLFLFLWACHFPYLIVTGTCSCAIQLPRRVIWVAVVSCELQGVAGMSWMHGYVEWGVLSSSDPGEVAVADVSIRDDDPSSKWCGSDSIGNSILSQNSSNCHVIWSTRPSSQSKCWEIRILSFSNFLLAFVVITSSLSLWRSCLLAKNVHNQD